MFNSILKTALRNIIRNKAFSGINLIGLSVSMSLAMLIILIVKEQMIFDNFHQDENGFIGAKSLPTLKFRTLT